MFDLTSYTSFKNLETIYFEILKERGGLDNIKKEGGHVSFVLVGMKSDLVDGENNSIITDAMIQHFKSLVMGEVNYFVCSASDRASLVKPVSYLVERMALNGKSKKK